MSLEKLEAADRRQDLQALGARLLQEVLRERPVDVGAPTIVLNQEHLDLYAGRAWMMGATVVMNTSLGRYVCRICGCWELEACEMGCSWVADDLCSACAEGDHE
jgi:hypothetical protein